MCDGCWEEDGCPQIDTLAVREAAVAVAAVYAQEYGACGGNLHVVLDDWNVEDESLAFCRQQIASGGYKPQPRWPGCMKRRPDSAEELAVEMRCHDLFKALTESERRSALALHRGFWGQA